MKEFTALAYARVSTDDKKQTTESQVREIVRWCEANNTAILETYVEEISAGDLNRPEFDRMMGRLMRERIDFIVAWSETRLSRNTDDMTDMLRTLRHFHVKVRYVSSAVEPETSTGSLINHINTWQGQEERFKLSINTKNGMVTAKIKGTHCGRPATLVFEHRVEENRSRIRLDGDNPTKIVSIESVYEYAKMGYSTSKAAEAIGVGRNTLERALAEECALDAYRDLQYDRPFWGKKICPKGVLPKRGVSLNIPEEKTASEEDAQKGPLLGNPEPLLGKLSEPLLNNKGTLLNSSSEPLLGSMPEPLLNNDTTLLGNGRPLLNSTEPPLGNRKDPTPGEIPPLSRERCLRCGERFDVPHGRVNPCPDCGELMLPCNACGMKAVKDYCLEDCPFTEEYERLDETGSPGRSSNV